MAEFALSQCRAMAQPSVSATQLPLLKLLLHASKYPAAAVNGALLGTVNAQGVVQITDVVPLFHTVLSLAPPVEVALAQVRAQKEHRSICCRHSSSIIENWTC